MTTPIGIKVTSRKLSTNFLVKDMKLKARLNDAPKHWLTSNSW
jgi:hypothetical protein